MCRRRRMHTMQQNHHTKKGKTMQFSEFSLSLVEDDCNVVNDFISKLPDELLSLILSHCSLREAARTCVLSKRWRDVWKLVLKFEFDAANIVGGACNARRFRQYKQDMFVACVNQVLLFHESVRVKSFRLQCNLGQKYYSEIDRWLQFAVNKALENLDIDLSKPGKIPSLPVENCYRIPSWIHERVLVSLRHLSLSSCALKAPLSTKYFSSLTSLSLASLHLSQCDISAFCDCPNLLSLSLLRCICPPHLKLASQHQYLPLKHLKIIYCEIAEMEIFGAVGLLSFECFGMLLTNLSLQNSAKPTTICYGHLLIDWQPLDPFYDFDRLVTDFPAVEKLMVFLPRLEGNLMSLRFPTFNKLQELVLDLSLQCASDALKFISSLLKASPYLQKLQVMQPWYTNLSLSESCWMIEIPECYSHHDYLREVKLCNFGGRRSELMVVNYLLRVAASLEKMDIYRKYQTYEGIGRWAEPLPTLISRKELRKILQKFVNAKVGSTSVKMYIF